MIDLNDTRPLGLSPAHYDLDSVVAGLRAGAASWVPSHFPNGRKIGDELRLANIQGDKPRKQGSCVIALAGEHAGDWIDFDDQQGGSPLNALEDATGLTGRALIEYAAEIAGSASVNGAKHPIAACFCWRRAAPMPPTSRCWSPIPKPSFIRGSSTIS